MVKFSINFKDLLASKISKVFLSTLLSIVWYFFFSSIGGEKYEFAFHDSFVRILGQRAAPDEILIVALDEESYRTWDLPMDRPIPRERYAKLVKRLAELGAKRVVFDVVFAGEGLNPDWDNEFASNIKLMPVVLGADHGVEVKNGIEIEDLILPYTPLLQGAKAAAFVGLKLQSGVVRNFFVEREANISHMPSLSEAGAGFFDQSDLKNANLPDANDLINYYGTAGSIKTISMYQVLEEEVPIPKGIIENKIVFVGLDLRTGLGVAQKDEFMTPFGSIFGVEIHATESANLLKNEWIKRPTASVEIFFGIAAVFVFSLLLFSIEPLRAAFTLIFITLLWVIAAILSLKSGYFIFGATVVTIFLPISAAINVIYSYLISRKKQAEIERAFSYYLAPSMVSQLKKDPSLLKLGGEEIVATAIFTDIKGFTTISESLGAKGVTSMLNAYFSETTRIVMEEGGTIIKFIGDAIFAIWGAPLPQSDHAERAVRAAIRLEKEIEKFNAKGIYPKLVTRVGINTGRMVVGNLGSDRRFDYTAIGDAVNLAARVEGVNKYFGTVALVTENTVEILNSSFNLLKMGAIKVVGKEIPVNLYRLSEMPYEDKLSSDWSKALEKFIERKWEEAKKDFEQIAENYQDFKVSAELYLKVIEEFQFNPPQAGWIGEISMEHK